MATDYGEKERAFIDGLKENTGRDLGEWMQAIAATGLLQRNDIIDWLRHKGFMFSKASWLERIHHNGGKPIYADVPKEAAPRRPPRRRESKPATILPPTVPAAPAPAAAAGRAHCRAGARRRSRYSARQGQGVSSAGPARAGEDQVRAPQRQFHGARKRQSRSATRTCSLPSASPARSCACI